MSVERAKVNTAKMIVSERLDSVCFNYFFATSVIVCGVLGTLALVTFVAGAAVPAWLAVVLSIPFGILYGVWKGKIVESGAKRMLEELQLEEGYVVRELPKPF